MTTSNDDSQCGICKLCLSEAPLKDSHIIPEWAYKPMYDEKHRFLVLRSDDIENSRFLQKGLREKLLCESCEVALSRYENYSRQLIFANSESESRGVEFFQEGPLIKVKNIDFKTLRLFQLSILWRASVSSLPFFGDVRLGPHEEKLRCLIDGENPGKHTDYGCIMAAYLNEDNTPNNLMTMPERHKLGGMRAYKFEFAGFWWFYVVSSNSDQYIRRELFLNPSADLVITKIKGNPYEYMHNYLAS